MSTSIFVFFQFKVMCFHRLPTDEHLLQIRPEREGCQDDLLQCSTLTSVATQSENAWDRLKWRSNCLLNLCFPHTTIICEVEGTSNQDNQFFHQTAWANKSTNSVAEKKRACRHSGKLHYIWSVALDRDRSHTIAKLLTQVERGHSWFHGPRHIILW